MIKKYDSLKLEKRYLNDIYIIPYRVKYLDGKPIMVEFDEEDDKITDVFFTIHADKDYKRSAMQFGVKKETEFRFTEEDYTDFYSSCCYSSKYTELEYNVDKHPLHINTTITVDNNIISVTEKNNTEYYFKIYISHYSCYEDNALKDRSKICFQFNNSVLVKVYSNKDSEDSFYTNGTITKHLVVTVSRRFDEFDEKNLHFIDIDLDKAIDRFKVLYLITPAMNIYNLTEDCYTEDGDVDIEPFINIMTDMVVNNKYPLVKERSIIYSNIYETDINKSTASDISLVSLWRGQLQSAIH